MSSEPPSGQPSSVSSGNPIELNEGNATIRAVQSAVRELELHRKYMERDLDQARSEMRDVRDHLKALEIKVDALPSKVWIGSVVLGGMALLSGLATFMLKLTGH